MTKLENATLVQLQTWLNMHTTDAERYSEAGFMHAAEWHREWAAAVQAEIDNRTASE